jgi:co-chaperonin GroES (HSP10)
MPDVKIRQLLGNRVLVERINPPATRNGIYLPESARDDNNTGGPKEFMVLAVGPGRVVKGKNRPVECQPGDRVICHSYTSGPVELEDGTRVITDDQILFVLPANPQEYVQTPNHP